MISISQNCDYDVLVVGGGPAGATFAARLAKIGYHVVVADRQTFPRDKVCGDFVGPVGLVELDAIGVTKSEVYRASNVIHRAAVYLDGAKLIERPLPQIESLPAHGRVIPRLLFDDVLWREAISQGAEVLPSHSLVDYEVDSQGVTATLKGSTTTVRARLLVGADGSASTVARKLTGDKPSRMDRILAVRAYYEGVSGPNDRCDLFFSGESFPGYFWLFPTGPTTANVGVGMVLETVPPSKAHLADLLDTLVSSDAGLRARLAGARRVGHIVGWPLTTYNPTRPLVGERVMLIGDAAGLINPLNGEGIQYALESAKWGADTAMRALSRNELGRDALAPYRAKVAESLDYDMALANALIAIVRNRALAPVWLEALRVIVARARSDRDYADTVSGILAGLTPARRALTSRVILGTASQAVTRLVFGALWRSFHSPLDLLQDGVAVSRLAFSSTQVMMRHSDQVIAWGADVIRHAGRLGRHVAQDAAARTSLHIAPPFKIGSEIRVH